MRLPTTCESSTCGDKIEIITVGEPVTPNEAYTLAKQDKLQFQWRALCPEGTPPAEAKKGAGHGIDREILLRGDRKASKAKLILVQAKGGETGVKNVGDLCGVMELEKAAMGVLIFLQPPTRVMVAEAVSTDLCRHMTIQDLTHCTTSIYVLLSPPATRRLRASGRIRLTRVTICNHVTYVSMLVGRYMAQPTTPRALAASGASVPRVKPVLECPAESRESDRTRPGPTPEPHRSTSDRRSEVLRRGYGGITVGLPTYQQGWQVTGGQRCAAKGSACTQPNEDRRGHRGAGSRQRARA